MRIDAGWFRRERTYRAAEKLNGALETFRVASAVDNMAGGQIVLLNVAADLCKELGEVNAARALGQRAERVARSNEMALAKFASRVKRRKPRELAKPRESEAEREAQQEARTSPASGPPAIVNAHWQPGAGVSVATAR